MVAAGVAIAALALALVAMLLDDWRVSQWQPSPVSLVERPVAVRGCRACLLASEAGDDYLRRHLESECTSGAPVKTVGGKWGEYHQPDVTLDRECAA